MTAAPAAFAFWSQASASSSRERIDAAVAAAAEALLADPSINYILPIYDSMSQFVVPALRITGSEGSVKVASFNGTPFVLDLNAAQINGQTLTLIAQDATGNPSAPLQVTAPDLTPPLQPTDLLLNPAGTSMTGTAEAGTTITVRGPNNAVVGTVEVPENGQFTVTLNPAQNNGQLLTVVSTDDAGNSSLPASYQTNDTSPPAVVTDMAINNTFDVLTGKGEPNAIVTVSRGGIVLGTGEVEAAGNFQVTLVPAAGSLATLAVTQSDGFNTSAVATYVTPLVAPPVPPTNVTLGSDGLTLQGNAPSGVGIRVYDAAGNLIGTGITPHPQLADKEIRKAMQVLWEDWVDEADADQLTDFYGLQALVARLKK